jgi:hypothetical protein
MTPTVTTIQITPLRRAHLDAIYDRMHTRLVLVKLTLVDVFAASLYKPADDTDERALDLLEQLAGDVRTLQTSVRRWTAQRERRVRNARTVSMDSGGAR